MHMGNALSKSQVDRLGERIRDAPVTASGIRHYDESDLRMLDAYRLTFRAPHERVVAVLRDDLSLEPTSRPAKSTPSIADKLRRESLRLSQMQDIAGCRLIVPNVLSQDEVVAQVTKAIDGSKIFDRREHPSHGYRAVHVIATHSGANVEIQIRSLIQHQWAELSEKLADRHGSEIKYGGGDKGAQDLLMRLSTLVASLEKLQHRLDELWTDLPILNSDLERLEEVAAQLKGTSDRTEDHDAELIRIEHVIRWARELMRSIKEGGVDLEAESANLSEEIRSLMRDASSMGSTTIGD